MPARGWTSRILLVAGLFVIVAGLRLGKDLFVPLALSVLFSLILSPLVALGLRLRLPRFVSVVGVVVLAFGCLGLLSYFTAGQAASLVRRFPEYKSNVQGKLDTLRGPLSTVVRKVREALRNVKEAPVVAPDKPVQDPLKVQVVEGGPDPLLIASTVLGPLMTAGAGFAVVVLLVIFFLLYQEDIRDRVIRLAGDTEVHATTQTITDATRGVSRFLFLQACVNVSYGATLALALFALGVPNAFLWGFLAALMRFIPYVGPIVAGVLPVLLSVAVFPGWTRPLFVAAVVVLLELVSNNFIEPLVYGKRTGLSPLAVVLAAVFWAWMWGGVGLILAVPLTVCLLSVGRHVPSLRFLAVMFGDEPTLDPKVQVYHRLLSGQREEAAELLEKERGKPLGAVFDDILVGVLSLAQTDLRRGALDPAKAESLFAALREIVDDLGEPAGPERPAEGSRAVVLCLPAGEAADEISARLFARVAEADDVRARALAADQTAGESLESIQAEGADVLVLCLAPPTNLLRARYLYKRLRRRFVELPIVVALWGGGDARAIEGRISPDGKAKLVTTFAEAEKVVAGLAREAAARKKIRGGAA